MINCGLEYRGWETRQALTVNAKMIYTYLDINGQMEYGKSTHDNEETPTIMKKHPR